jgi:multidrug transporter EmrE-like cation transporter
MVNSVKKYALTNKNIFILTAVVLYMLQPIFFAHILKKSTYSIIEINIFWNVISLVCVTLLGVYYFKEHIRNIQFIGIFFAISGIILINLPSIQYDKKN